MSVAGLVAQKLVKQTIEEPASVIIEEMEEPSVIASAHKKRPSSGIANIVLDLPQHAERNLFNHDNWTQNLYESLLNSLRFGEILKRIEEQQNNTNADAMREIMQKYHAFERWHHTKMNG